MGSVLFFQSSSSDTEGGMIVTDDDELTQIMGDVLRDGSVI